MNQTETFPPEPFPRELAMEQALGTFESELEGLELEEELRRTSGFRPSPGGRPRAGRPPMPRSGMPRRPGTTRPKRPPRRPRPWPVAGPAPWPVYPEPYPLPYPVSGEPATVAAPHGSEYVRWTQDCLNRVMSTQLPVDGVMTPATRSVVRSFQQRENLSVTGIAGPDTEEALKRACSGAAPAAAGDAQPDQEWSFESEEESSINEMEVAAAMKDAMKQLPPGGVRPNYQFAGRLDAAINNPKASGAGLYLIMFNAEGKTKAYSGKSENVRKRLMQHRLCAQMLGLPVANHRVFVAPVPSQQLRATEKAINTRLLDKHKDVVTNQRRELEEALLGEGWN